MQARYFMKVSVLALVGIALLLGACSGAEQSTAPSATDDVGALVEERCTQCHDVSKVTQAQKTQEQWSQTVANMVEKGANLSADEQVAVVNYLAEKYGP